MGPLDGIAANMRMQLASAEKGWVQRALFGGLSLVLEKRGRTWRLAIGRIGKPPSETEAKVVGAALAAMGGVYGKCKLFCGWGQK